MGIGLYLHIPFCKKKCDYCDFASYAGCRADWQPVIAAMKAEIARAEGLAVSTVFFGGGTPTLLPAETLIDLLDTARRHFIIDPDAEITVEANPGTVNAKGLAVLRKAGVNRLSIGAQAMQAPLLQALGRIHRWADVERAVADARAAGFSNLNIDLMYGLPGQTPRDFRETLQAAIALDIPHLSLYSLIIEEGTPFHARYAEHPEALPGEEAAWEMADDALWITGDAGIRRYEISNYAKPGFACRHNLGYWLRRDYLGIGVAAHSLLRNFRWGNAHTIGGYLAGEREEETIITGEEARFERLMLGLRLVDGIPWEEQALYDQFRDKLALLRGRGLVDWNEARVWPTARGLDLQNRIVLTLMGD